MNTHFSFTKTLCGAASLALLTLLGSCAGASSTDSQDYVSKVNPYIGNISHLLVPTYPTVHLPNSMMRVYPVRPDYTGDQLHGLPVSVTGHRGGSAFLFSMQCGADLKPVVDYSYDNEHITPYAYDVDLCDGALHVDYAVSHQSAMYKFTVNCGETPSLVLGTRHGDIQATETALTGYQQIGQNARVYVYMEPTVKPESTGAVIVPEGSDAASAAYLTFAPGTKSVTMKYAISFISVEQAQKNMVRELTDYATVESLASVGKKVWNDALSAIQVQGGTPEQQKVLYTSFYRTLERPVCISEDGRYFSGFDGQVHEDEGTPYYTDDWLWDTYRAAHPLRILVNQTAEENILASFIRTSEQRDHRWLPTFPSVSGDGHAMNSNHAIASMADALAKGLNVDFDKAYTAARNVVEQKTLCPWSANEAGWIDEFFWKNGYIPGQYEGEKETDPNVHDFEDRQPIAVTLGTSFDLWCLSKLAEKVGATDDAARFLEASYSYRNLFNPATCFFHPKDKDGKFIEPFDYRFSGGMGARKYYDENNGWVYRWDIQHSIADLVKLHGGPEQFVANLDQTFREPLGRQKYQFYAQLPDHTGNVGQFSMANEPSLHVPYMYNYAGAPWKTQKRVRQMLDMWFRNDLMGVPGDEDGGGMTAFVVFSSLGFYPVTPGSATYNIGSPLFTNAKVRLSNGNVFEIDAPNASVDNKYIQSATLNGKEWNQPWFTHEDLMNGGKLVLVMGSEPNKQWGSDVTLAPPSIPVK